MARISRQASNGPRRKSGGPQGDVGPYAIPKKKEEPPPPPPTKPKKIEGIGDYSIQVSVPLVEVPVMVMTKDGQFISSLQKENFKIYEDGVQQIDQQFQHHRTRRSRRFCWWSLPTNYMFMVDALQASYSFAPV